MVDQTLLVLMQAELDQGNFHGAGVFRRLHSAIAQVKGLDDPTFKDFLVTPLDSLWDHPALLLGDLSYSNFWYSRKLNNG